MTKRLTRFILLLIMVPALCFAFSLDEWTNAVMSQDAKHVSAAKSQKILFFYMSTCGFCHKIEPLLYEISKELNIEVQYVSADGRPMMSGHPFITNNALVSQFGITAFPTVYLVDAQTHDAYAIAQGLTSIDIMKARIMQARSMLEANNA